MAINFYGMPMQPTSYALNTMWNLIEQGSAGGEVIFLDSDISAKIYSMTDIAEQQYKELSERAKQELDIKKPNPATVSSWMDIAGAFISGALDTLVEFIGDVVEFACEYVASVVGGVSKGLGSIFSAAGPILLIGGIVAAVVLLK